MDHKPHIIPQFAYSGQLSLGEDELVAWGESLGAEIKPPLIITLAGDLGAGKTTLTRAICKGYGVTEDVTSPTYSIVHEYQGAHSTVFHIDLYRLESAAELINIGWDDILNEQALIIIEWPERAAGKLPQATLPIVLEYVPDTPDKRLLLAG